MKSKTPVSKKQLLESKLRTMIRKIIKESNDPDAIRELELFADNDSKMYDLLHNTYVPALMKFKKRGTFDRNKALKLMEYYVKRIIKAYEVEYGDKMRIVPKDRMEIGEYFLKNLEDEGYLDNPE